VSASRNAFLAAEWREVVAEDPGVREAHLLAAETVEDTCYATEADARAEATRRQALRGILRHRYEVVLPLTSETEDLDLGDVVTLTYARFGLDQGAPFRVIGVEPDARGGRVTLTLWGPADPVSRMAVTLAMSGSGAVPVPLVATGGPVLDLAMSGTGTRVNPVSGTGGMTVALVMDGYDLA
jgi:hypothetical protein